MKVEEYRAFSFYVIHVIDRNPSPDVNKRFQVQMEGR